MPAAAVVASAMDQPPQSTVKTLNVAEVAAGQVTTVVPAPAAQAHMKVSGVEP